MAELEIDLVTAAVDRLAADPGFRDAVITGLIGTDAADTATADEKVAQAWLFQGLDDDGRPYRDPEGTGKAAVVLAERGEWSANAHNTARFPVLLVLVYADASRAADGSAVARDQDRRAKTVARVVDRVFHDAANAAHEWPGMFVVSCVRASGLTIREVPNTQGLTVRAEQRFEVVTG